LIRFETIPRTTASPAAPAPLPRATMDLPGEIIARMATDMIAIRKAEDACCEANLLECGWTTGQVHLYHRRAADAARRIEASDIQKAVRSKGKRPC